LARERGGYGHDRWGRHEPLRFQRQRATAELAADIAGGQSDDSPAASPYPGRAALARSSALPISLAGRGLRNHDTLFIMRRRSLEARNGVRGNVSQTEAEIPVVEAQHFGHAHPRGPPRPSHRSALPLTQPDRGDGASPSALSMGVLPSGRGRIEDWRERLTLGRGEGIRPLAGALG
jgi:hypothetical protein